MKWTAVRRIATAFLIPIGLAACESLDGITDLEVENQNNPDAQRAINSAQDVEALVTGGFFTFHEGAYQYLPVTMGTGADEYSASWGNFGMRDFSSEPRKAWNNASSYSYAYATDGTWFGLYGAISSVYDGIRAIAENPSFAEEINVPRANAFGKFVQGLAHGWVALAFDSGFVLDENVDLEGDTLQLLPYPNVMAFALGYLQEARDLADGKSWTLDATWINGNALTGTELAGWASAFYALYLAQMARTPAEAAALTVPGICADANACWALVESKASEGLTKALNGPSAGTTIGGHAAIGFVGDDFWWHAPVWYSQNPGTTWARADYKLIGTTEAGAGKGYDNWLSLPVLSRVSFELDIPDKRITPGPPPHTQFVDCGTYFCKWSPTNMDPARGTYHFSSYTGTRQAAHRQNAGIGFIEIMTVPTLELTMAEAMARQGKAGAAALLNNTRVAAGLTAAADGDADLLEKIHYDFMIENYSYCSGCGYFTRRRAGPLAAGDQHHAGLLVGTQRHFAIPGSELEVLQKVNYTYGGAGEEGDALAPSSEPYCKGPTCGGGGGAVSGASFVMGGSGGTAVPASLVYKRERPDEGRPQLASERATRYR